MPSFRSRATSLALACLVAAQPLLAQGPRRSEARLGVAPRELPLIAPEAGSATGSRGRHAWRGAGIGVIAGGLLSLGLLALCEGERTPNDDVGCAPLIAFIPGVVAVTGLIGALIGAALPARDASVPTP